MTVLFMLIGISLFLASVFLFFFTVSARRGDFDRMDLDAWKPLLDNNEKQGKQK